jgi:AcrR family transcriptional regulator
MTGHSFFLGKECVCLKDKKQLIINAAIKCFALKGFHATSIQEIVDMAGIAKGSVYSYFKSKEDLLFIAIKHEYDRMMGEIFTVANDMNLSARERLTAQLQLILKVTLEHSDFIATVKNEKDLLINDQMKAFVANMHKQDFQWYCQSILDIYGDSAQPYVYDAAMIIQAVVNRFTYEDRKEIVDEELSLFFMDRLDDMVYGMIKKKQKPMLNKENLTPAQGFCASDHDSSCEDSLKAIQSIRTGIQESKLEAKIKLASLSYLTVLDHELTKPHVDPVIAKAMIAHLQGLKLPELVSQLNHLEHYVQG